MEYLRLGGAEQSNSLLLAGHPELSYMTKSIIQMLSELWQSWCCDLFTWEPVQWKTTVSVKNLFLRSTVSFPDVASFHFLMSCHWSPERGDQDLPLHFPSWGSCRLWWGHSSTFFNKRQCRTIMFLRALVWREMCNFFAKSWSFCKCPCVIGTNVCPPLLAISLQDARYTSGLVSHKNKVIDQGCGLWVHPSLKQPRVFGVWDPEGNKASSRITALIFT